jgi:hypothetical protein
MRWRRIDLQRVIGEHFGGVHPERTVGKLLKALCFPRISARPRHPGQDARTTEASKKNFAAALNAHLAGVRKGKPSRSASRTSPPFAIPKRFALRNLWLIPPGSARRTGSSADGRDAERGRASLPTGALTVPKNMTLIFLPSRSPELNPVENIWRYLRANWLSNRVFESYDAIIDAACAAWRNLIARPQTITSIGMRDRAHIGQSCGPLASNAACDFRRLYII